MADFPINVKVDPGDSKTKIDDVGRTVDKAEKQATAATKAFKSLGEAIQYMAGQTLTSASKAFASLGDAISYKMNAQITQAQRAFGGLADAIQREHAMMVTIRGDTQAYARDVQVLNSLMDRGKITAQEYDAALASAGQKHLGEEKPTSLLDGLAGQALAIAGPAAIAGKAISAIGDAFEEIRQKKQALNEASVDMLRYKDTIESARESAEGLRETSLVLGADIRETTNLFLSVADATSKLGKSEEEISAITRNLGIIMKTDGKSIGDVSVVLERLQFAMEKGKLESGDLAMIMRRFPPLGEALAKTFGMTQEQLLKVAEAGKLTRTEIAKVWESLQKGDPDSLRKRQQQLVATFQNKDAKEQARTFYEFRDAMLELQKQAAKTGVTLDYEMKGMTLVTPKMRELAGETVKVAESTEDVTDANTYLLDSWSDVVDRGNLVSVGFDKLKEKAHGLFQALLKLKDPWGNTRDTRNTLARGIDEFIAFAHEGEQAAEKLSAKWKKAAAEAAKDAETLAKAFAKMQRTAPKPMLGSELGGRDAYDRYVAAEVDRLSNIGDGDQSAFLAGDLQRLSDSEQAWKRMRTEAAKYKAELASKNDGIARGFNAIEAEIRDTATLTENMLVNAYKGVEDSIVNAFRTGKFEWQAFADQIMADLTRLAIRKAIVGGLDLFGSSGLDFTASAGADKRVGFASGGYGMVKGGGGMTDNVPVSFWATQGERVIVQTPGQRMRDDQASRQSAQAPQQPAVLYLDERALLRAMNSPMGARVLDDLNRKYPRRR